MRKNSVWQKGIKENQKDSYFICGKPFSFLSSRMLHDLQKEQIGITLF
jgi:hypothetical protein